MLGHTHLDLHEAVAPDSKIVDILFLVFHGGSALDGRKDQIGKAIDFQTLSENIHSVIGLHFHSALGRVALRMVPCVNVCCEALKLLCEVCLCEVCGGVCLCEVCACVETRMHCKHTMHGQINPTPVSRQQYREGIFPPSPQQDRAGKKTASFTQSFEEILEGCPGHVPIGTVPLLATEHHEYHKSLATVSEMANKVYWQFLESDEGVNFNGQVGVVLKQPADYSNIEMPLLYACI